MTRLRVLLSRLVATLTGRRRDDELQDEIETHLSLLADEHRRRGLSEAEARAAARRSFGGIAQARDDWRRQRRLPSIDALWQDVRFGARRLFAERWSTAAAVGILALGIGSTVVMSDMLDRLLLRPPEHIASPDRVRRLYTTLEGGKPRTLITFYAQVGNLERGLAAEASHVAAFFREEIGFGRGAKASRFRVVTYSRSYFDVLGITPHMGVLPSVHRPYRPDAVVVSHGLWQREFGSRADVIGMPLRLGKRIYTVAAVAPLGFAGVDLEPADAWLPLETRIEDAHRLGPTWRIDDHYAMLQVLVRLKPDIDLHAAESRATAVYRSAPQQPMADGRTRSTRVWLGELAPARQPGGTDEARIGVAIAMVSILVLLVACGNVGNLLFARGLRRGRELAVKTAMGATRSRLLRELLTEAALLAVLATVVAQVFTLWGGAAMRGLLLPEGMAEGSGADVRLVAITSTLCIVATLALGLLPALALVARASLTPGRAIHRDSPSLLLESYVALQVTFSVPLLVGATLFGLSLWHARQVDFGMTTSRVAIVSTDMSEADEPARQHRVHRDMQARLAQLPQVEAISAVTAIPLRGGSAQWIEGPDVKLADGESPPFYNLVDSSFFSVMGIRIVAGRGFTETENVPGGRPVAVINESMAHRFWPNTSPLGRCFRPGGEKQPCAEIVGVVADSSMWAMWQAGVGRGPFYYLPIERDIEGGGATALLVRTTESPSDLVELLRRQASTADGDLPYIEVSAFDDVFLPALRPLQLGATVFAIFAGMTLVIASAGLAAVTASGIARRTRELGIRLALGAEPGRLVRMVLGRSLSAAVVGLIAGAALSIAGERSLRAVLFGVGEGDYRVIALAVVTLAIVAAVAAWIPARRAGQVDPAVALANEVSAPRPPGRALASAKRERPKG